MKKKSISKKNNKKKEKKKPADLTGRNESHLKKLIRKLEKKVYELEDKLIKMAGLG